MVIQLKNLALNNRYISNIKHARLLAYFSILTLALLLSFTINPVGKETSVEAITGTANAATTSLTLSSTSNEAKLTISPTNSNGTFTSSTGSDIASFMITTNNYTGYTLGITASDNTGNLVNTNTNDTIASITANLTESSFNTSTNNNKWGYKPSRYVDTTNNTTTTIDNTGNNSVFLPSPTTSPTLLGITSTANSIDNNSSSVDNYTIALGLRADYHLAPGTYTKTFTLTALANDAPYTIHYNKNTSDTVTNMPTTSTSGSISDTSITLANNIPQRAHYTFIGWCNKETTTTNGIDSCTGTNPTTGAAATVYNPNGNNTNLTYYLDQTTENTTTLYAMWKIDTFTCTKQYRRELQNGAWETYIVNGASADYYIESVEPVNYGSTCTYSKSITDYRGSSSAANNAQGSTSAVVTGDTTLSLDFYRNTYSLTVSAGSNTSNPTGSGTYRWGQVVTVSVDKNTDITCTSYGTPTWTATAGTAPAAGASTSFTMPTSNATITATSAASSVAQTITLSRSGGASGINIGGTNYTSSSVSLTCGTYNISGNYDSGYEFNSWSASGSASVASTSSASTTMTVSGSGTLILTGKSSKLWFQNATSAQCGQTMYDNRGTDAYKNIAYTTALINGLCWMTRNLDLPGGTVLQRSDSNIESTRLRSYTIPTATSGVSAAYNSNSTTCSSSSPCYSYYTFDVVTVGQARKITTGEVTADICPNGWRIPTADEYHALLSTYTDLRVSPWYSALAGTWYNNAIQRGGEWGFYWTSTVSGASSAYLMSVSYLQGGGTMTTLYGSRTYMHSVRCVAK